MSAMPASAWMSTEPGHAAIPTRLPEELEILLAHLTDHGRERLASQLAAAVNGPDPARAAARVLKSWWYTLYARNQAGYFEAIRRPPPDPAEAEYQSADELRVALGL